MAQPQEVDVQGFVIFVMKGVEMMNTYAPGITPKVDTGHCMVGKILVTISRLFS